MRKNAKRTHSPVWEQRQGKLERTLRFADFREAIRFVNRLAEVAEAYGHHPSIAIQYNTVTLQLWTHGTGGVTVQDMQLARAIDDMLR